MRTLSLVAILGLGLSNVLLMLQLHDAQARVTRSITQTGECLAAVQQFKQANATNEQTTATYKKDVENLLDVATRYRKVVAKYEKLTDVKP